MRGGEVELDARRRLDVAVAMELAAVVGGDRGDAARVPPDQLDAASARLGGVVAGELTDPHVAGHALDHGQDGVSGLVVALDRVDLPVPDGLETPFRMERAYLREIAKGPDSLVTPLTLRRTDSRLVDITASKDELREARHNDALAYLKRGETFPYNVSEDNLKGGVPAKRSNIRTRHPFWYSLGVPKVTSGRILAPEHFDKRFIATAVSAQHQVVVIDTLYAIAPNLEASLSAILWSLNSVLGWYQLELRGRTQHGEGVLKVKLPDWRGVLVLNPDALRDAETLALQEAFAPIANKQVGEVADELARPEHNKFDQAVVAAAGAGDPEGFRLLLERELRAAMGERHERSDSVAEAKVARSSASKPTASVGAYAARIASVLSTFPDPRVNLPDGQPTFSVAVTQPIEGDLALGADLFSAGDVLAGDDVVASTPGMLAAEYVRAVLLHDVHLPLVDVPCEPGLDQTMDGWRATVADWYSAFDEQCEKALKMIHDPRLRGQIRDQALRLLHAI